MGGRPQPPGHAPLSLPPDPELAADLYRAAHLTGRFVLRSGKVSDEYFDKYRFESDPALLARLAERMARLIPADADYLGGVELGGVPIATAIALQTRRPAIFVRKEAKTYGACLAVEGADVRGKRVCLIEDVISTGGAVVDAAARLAEAGAEVSAVVCAVWRGEGEPAISGLNAPVFAAFMKADLEQVAA